MLIKELNILNYRNISEANLSPAKKINCFVGQNGMGKTNLLDAIYLLSFTKSSLTSQDAQCIMHSQDMAMVKATYVNDDEEMTVSCGLKVGRKKQLRLSGKDYKRLLDHIGLIPLVLVSPRDQELISDGSDERRRFLDAVISQYDRPYLEHLTTYQGLLKQRNALLKQLQERPANDADNAVLDILEERMAAADHYIFNQRREFINAFIPYFNEIYSAVSSDKESVSLSYHSQLADRDILLSLHDTRQRDIILGWTSQGVHKDDITMLLNDYPLKQVGSQGQQKTYLIALKLGQALFLADRAGARKPILLLDDIFDRLDQQRVENIIRLVTSERFGQIFITDTDRHHLVALLNHKADPQVFHSLDGKIVE